MATGTDKLAQLSPYFQPWAQFLIDVAERYYNIPCSITSGFRTAADQERVCRQNPGVPCATPGRSSHQYGMAVDIVGGTGKTSAQHKLLRRIADAIGFAPEIADDPVHFEHPEWRRVRSLI